MKKSVCGIALLGIVAFGSDANAALIWRSDLNGNANDLVGSRHGIVGAGTPVATMDRHGNPSGATLFNGASFFNIPGTGAGGDFGQSLAAGSIAVWVQVHNSAVTGNTDGQSGPVALGSSGGGTTQYFSLVNTSAAVNADNNAHGWRTDLDRGDASNTAPLGRMQKVALGTGLDGSGYAVTTANGNTPIWQHLTATFQAGGELRLYVNGVLQSNPTNLLTDLTPLIPTNPWTIGSERANPTPPGGRNFVGALDDLRIYDHALSQGEIDDIAHLILGDVNNDGVPTIADFNLIRDNFGDDVFLRRLGDLNGDRVVDFKDFNEWKNAAGPALAALASFNVPEPGAVVLVAMALGALGSVRTRRFPTRR